MKFLVAFILTALLSYAAGFYLPWWSIAIAAFLVAVAVPQKPGKAFLSGFLSLFLLWVILALYIDMGNQHILSMKIAELLFKSHSHALIMSVTGLVAGLVGGFAALSGAYLRQSKSGTL
jgi:cbb3-type cytochrome oxidase subunit 1